MFIVAAVKNVNTNIVKFLYVYKNAVPGLLKYSKVKFCHIQVQNQRTSQRSKIYNKRTSPRTFTSYSSHKTIEYRPTR